MPRNVEMRSTDLILSSKDAAWEPPGKANANPAAKIQKQANSTPLPKRKTPRTLGAIGIGSFI